MMLSQSYNKRPLKLQSSTRGTNSFTKPFESASTRLVYGPLVADGIGGMAAENKTRARCAAVAYAPVNPTPSRELRSANQLTGEFLGGPIQYRKSGFVLSAEVQSKLIAHLLRQIAQHLLHDRLCWFR
jgi:hypothetical protein